ncbi:TPA: glucose-6-phosphate isomerase, partial [Clostridium perfringens]
MKKGLVVDLSKAAPYLKSHEVAYMQETINQAHNKLHNGTGAGNDFLGWVDLPVNYDKDEFARIKEAA